MASKESAASDPRSVKEQALAKGPFANETMAEVLVDEAAPVVIYGLSPFAWGVLFGLGYLVYEVTHRPTWGLAVVCAKFGWNDLLTSWWLIGRDPRRVRGVICGLFYLAAAASKVAMAAFLGAAAILWFAALAGERPPRELMGLSLTAVLGLSLLAIFALGAAISARVAGLRVWLDGALRQSREADEWPPRHHGQNRTLAVSIPVVIVVSVTAPQFAGRMGFLPVLGLILVTATTLWWLFQSVAALTPDECWPELREGLLDEVEVDVETREGPWNDDGQDDEREFDRPLMV